MSGDEGPASHGPIRQRGPDLIPDQKSLELMNDQHAWDTIILCSLIGNLFGTVISPKEITSVINARRPIAAGLDTIRYMFAIAKSPAIQKDYPTTCRYQKWEAVKMNLEKRKGVRDTCDGDERSAWVLYKEALSTVREVKSGQLGSPMAWWWGDCTGTRLRLEQAENRS